uniref:Uncharacterized protein n=1 Tax=Moniliophthora roreri TaxID=221103 RepID=A0A0W0G8D4_MONRR
MGGALWWNSATNSKKTFDIIKMLESLSDTELVCWQETYIIPADDTVGRAEVTTIHSTSYNQCPFPATTT